MIGIYLLAATITVRVGTDIFHLAKTMITVYFVLTMTTNFILTGKYFIILMGLLQRVHTRLAAIALRLFLAGNPLQGSRPHGLIIFTLIESCALYTLNIVAILVSFLSGSFGQYAAVDAIIQIIVSIRCASFLPFECH